MKKQVKKLELSKETLRLLVLGSVNRDYTLPSSCLAILDSCQTDPLTYAC